MAKEKHRTGKLKYGSVSALMLAMVLIALIALNAGIYALEKNKGWRIDYFVVSERLMPRVKDSQILTDVMGSDLCPIQLIIE